MMLRNLLLAVLFLLWLALPVSAASGSEETLALVQQGTESAPVPVQSLMETIQPFLVKLSLVVGGIFGLYLIMVLLRVYYDRRILKVLQGIRYDLDQLNAHYDIPASHQRIGIVHKLWHKSQNLFQKKKAKIYFRNKK